MIKKVLFAVLVKIEHIMRVWYIHGILINRSVRMSYTVNQYEWVSYVCM